MDTSQPRIFVYTEECTENISHMECTDDNISPQEEIMDVNMDTDMNISLDEEDWLNLMNSTIMNDDSTDHHDSNHVPCIFPTAQQRNVFHSNKSKSKEPVKIKFKFSQNKIRERSRRKLFFPDLPIGSQARSANRTVGFPIKMPDNYGINKGESGLCNLDQTTI